MVYSNENKIKIKTVPEKELKADLLGKYIKTTILKMLKELKEGVDKVDNPLFGENTNNEIENLEIKPKRNIGVKSIIMEMKTLQEGFKGRFEQPE